MAEHNVQFQYPILDVFLLTSSNPADQPITFHFARHNRCFRLCWIQILYSKFCESRTIIELNVSIDMSRPQWIDWEMALSKNRCEYLDYDHSREDSIKSHSAQMNLKAFSFSFSFQLQISLVSNSTPLLFHLSFCWSPNLQIFTNNFDKIQFAVNSSELKIEKSLWFAQWWSMNVVELKFSPFNRPNGGTENEKLKKKFDSWIRNAVKLF